MFNISRNGIITLNRGDTARLPLFINAGTEMNPVRYELQDTDKVYLGVMEPNSPFENAIIKKVYTKEDVNENGDIMVEFYSDDTVNLMPDDYYYEIKADIMFNGQPWVNTIVPRTKFTIVE